MARQARIKAPGQIYSVVTRVNNSDFAFKEKSPSEAFLEHLKAVKKKHGFKLYGFMIMASHVHLIIEPCAEFFDISADISAIMRDINGGFAQKYNMHNKRKGHFWMQRFSSKLVERGRYLANTVIYFALNPVKAGITDNPLKYEYSSVHALTGGRFSDLADPLPEDIREIVLEFLKRNDYFELLAKCARIMKRFSFDLRKTRLEQRFRNFTGSNKFIRQFSFVHGADKNK